MGGEVEHDDGRIPRFLVYLWQLPSLLKADRPFLGKRDTRIGKVALFRGFAGIVTLVVIAYVYPVYVQSLDNVDLGGGPVPPAVNTALKIANNLLVPAFMAIIFLTGWVIVFAAVVVLFARSGARLGMLRGLARPIVAIAEFTGVLAAGIELIKLLGSAADWLASAIDRLSRHALLILPAIFLFLVELLIAVLMVAILCVMFRAIYWATVDVFRADDAHPLLAPVVTTSAALTLALYGWITDSPTGMPYDVGFLMTFLGPLGVTAVNVCAFRRIWREHHKFLFRDGPQGGRSRGRGERADASSFTRRTFLDGAAQTGLAVIGVIAIWKLVQDSFFAPPLFPLPAPVVASLPMGSSVNAVAFSPNGRTLAGGTGGNGDGGTVQLWDVIDPANATALGQPLTGLTFVSAVAFSPDGRTLASGNGPGTVQLWNVDDPAHPSALGQALAAPTGYVNSVAFSPDGHTLAAGSGQADDTGHGAIQLWNVIDPGHPIALGETLTIPEYGVNSVAFSPDGRTLASASGLGTVQLWNLADPAHPTALGQALTGATDGVNSVAFSPSGRILAGGTGSPGSGVILLWDVTNPLRPHPAGPALSGPTTFINAVAFSPDGNTLAGVSGEPTLTAGAIQLWNVTDPAKPTIMGKPLNDNESSVGAVAFSPDGRILAAGDGDLDCIDLWTLS